MKKVLFVATVVRMHINVFHTPYLKWFQEQGWETTVAARNDYENPEDCIIPYCDNYIDIPFERNPFKKENISAYRQLKKLINENNYDIVYCHTPVGAMIARLASVGARKKGTKVVYMAHGFHFFKGAPLKNWIIYYPVEKFLSRFTDMLLTINKEDYEAAYKFHAQNVEYVPGVGIDFNRFLPSANNKTVLRKEFNISDDSFVLMSVGELSKRKNQIVIIKALEKLNDPSIEYVVCGDGAYRDFYQSTAEELSVSNQIHFLGFRKDVNLLYDLADVFVFPSLQEGLPVSVMEAMAMKLPVIASKIRGNEDLVIHGKGGFIISKNDVNGYANAIKSMKKNKKQLYKMGNFNKDYVQQYNINNVVGIITDKIMSLVEGD